jgi:Zn-dependent protease with chaperone function
MKPPAGPSLSHRAFLALGLWAGYYLLVFAIAGGLLYFTYWVFDQVKTPSLFLVVLAIGSGIAALRILWASFPRWQKFQPPGVKLDPARHPLLFEEIRRIARDTHQRAPSEVYLIADVNAWVSKRGGFLGLFRKPVLAMGLPLLKILTQLQFRSVLVHEFGHYVGGDTALGPWVYKTYAAIQRTIETLEGSDSVWRFPFLAYAKLFTRTTLAVSREQELSADALAAKIAGAKPAAQALRLIEAASNAFPSFVGEELMPLLNAEFRAPLCEGFARYLSTKEISRFVMRRVNREMTDKKRDPYRTHPPLPDRLERMATLPAGFETREDPPAMEMLTDLDGLERELIAFVTENPAVRKMPMISWDDAGEKAFLPQWREQAKIAREQLKDVRPEQFPELKLTEIGRRFEKQGSDAQARSIAMSALGSALLVSLRDQGWTIAMEPGDRPTVIRDGVRVEPFHIFVDMAEGKMSRDEWKERCKSGGFEGLNLGPAEAATS